MKTNIYPTGVERQLRLRKGPPRTPKDGKIHTIKQLHNLLQKAVELEHSTIPPYLTALYSIPDGTNPEAAQIIKSVVMEEMLHMILAANLLNSIRDPKLDLPGPCIDHPKFIPEYPTKLPVIDAGFEVHLMKFCPSSIETFVKIERPTAPKGEPHNCHCIRSYHTIGQFYEAIEEALRRFSKDEDIFKGDPKNQVTSAHYYGGGGKIYPVTDLDSALDALKEIVGQGEGVHDSVLDGDEELGEAAEVAHFFRFKEILAGKHYRPTDSVNSPPSGSSFNVQWDAAYPMQDDPKVAKYPKDSELFNKATEANKTYTRLLIELHKSLNGKPELLMKSVKIMYELKYQTIELMKIPLPNGHGTAGPSFEYTAP